LMENRVKNKSEFPEEETLSLGDVPDWMEKSTIFGYPTPELMVRWAQANVFLGVMQFSLAPWDFGPEANRICREAARLHLEYVPVLQKFAREALKYGDPIIRPVFWLAPSSEEALICDDQFLVGDEILVAPVLRDKQRSRSIYFPPGEWLDPRNGLVHPGPTRIENYPAALDVLPYFIRKKT
jgi:alpha-glucosidase (family GH31 glycosyl hydrolase)